MLSNQNREDEYVFFFSSRRRHTRCLSDWSSDVCSSDLSPRESKALYPLPVAKDAFGNSPRAQGFLEVAPTHTREDGPNRIWGRARLQRLPKNSRWNRFGEGHDLGRAVKSFKSCRALAPEARSWLPQRVFPQPVQPCH